MPSDYYKDLMYKLYKDNQILECNVHCLSNQVEAQVPNVTKANEAIKLVATQEHVGTQEHHANEDVSMAVIFKELNDLKMKGKVLDMFLVGSTCLIILLFVLVVAVLVGSFRN